MTENGKIRALPAGKNFGFILGDDGSDRFFQAGAMSPISARFEDLEVGDYVAYEAITADDGRLRAVNVQLRGKAGDAEMSEPFRTEE